MTDEEKPSKDKNFWKVLSAALELDVKKGHLKWTLSDLSRKSKITRSLIYYYFGRSKLDILKAAIKVIGDDVVGLTEERNRLWMEGKFEDSLWEARNVFENAPFIPSFIMEHRDRENEVGVELRALEKGFLKKIQDFFPHLSEAQVKAIYSIYWGLIFSPLADKESLNIAIESILFITRR